MTYRELKNGLRRWFSYMKPCFNCYDFDYSSVLTMERHQLIRLRDNIAKYHNHVNAERDIERMNTTLRLLDIISEEIFGRFSNGKWEFDKYVNFKNKKRFGVMGNREDALWKIDLYQRKAWCLYHEMRKAWLRTWWD